MKLGLVTVLCVVLLVASGCGGTKNVPVSGSIVYKGKPVADSTVMFTPSASGADGAKVATGRTDAQGKFTLGTEAPGDGATPGEYTVSVTPNLPEPKDGDYSAPPPPPFPPRYTNATGSD
ncbi:MAG: hypothetical protein AB7F89_01550, partial [Pirellulaceae bacterium]